jgi:hypothetical protein
MSGPVTCIRLAVALAFLLVPLVGQSAARAQEVDPSSVELLPEPHYLQHPPQYIPPSPDFPLTREQAVLETAAAAQVPPPEKAPVKDAPSNSLRGVWTNPGLYWILWRNMWEEAFAANETPAPPSLPSPPKPKHPGKLRLRVPFTPVNADGSLGRRTLITITIEDEDRQHALEVADQIIDQLFVEPRLDDLMDDINKRLDNRPLSTDVPPPPTMPLPPPAPPGSDLEGAVSPDAAAQWAEAAGMIADTVDACEAAFNLLGLHLNLGPLAMRFHMVASYDGHGQLHVGIDGQINKEPEDPNARMKVGLYESEDSGPITNESFWFWATGQHPDLTFERVDGDIGP